MPHAVWYAGKVQVSSGFKIENTGRMRSELMLRLSFPPSAEITASVEASLPVAAMVSTVPTGSASVMGRRTT